MRPLTRALSAGVAALSVAMMIGATVPSPEPSASDDPRDDVRQAEWWLADYGIEQAWDHTRGAGVRIAIIDTGIAHTPELDGAVVGGTDVSGNGADDGRTPVGVTDYNHGTWVASLAAARGTGEHTGMIGVAPEAELLSISVGFGSAASVPFVDQIPKAIRWAVDNGADIINLSLTSGTLSWDESWDSAFLYAFQHDVVVIAAAGNRGSGTTVVGAPATIPGVLTVAGVDRRSIASVGASTQGITIGVSAPSEEILGVSADGSIVVWQGTSGAAPIVAGIAALVRSAHPDLDAENVINRIIQTAVPSAHAVERPDALYGYGLVDAAAAVSRTGMPIVDANPMGSLEDWIRLYRRAVDAPTPEPTVAPVEVAPLPPGDAPTAAGSPFLPSPDSLRYGTIPLVTGTLAGILVALGITAAARRIRSARRSRTPSN